MPDRRPRAPRLFALAFCLCVAGCGERPANVAPATPVTDEDAATQAPAGPAAAAAPRAAAAPSAAMAKSWTIDDPGIGSQVGVRTPGLGLVADGRAGWLVFGPYAHLDAGKYEVAIQGIVQTGHAGPLHVDIARDKGATVVAARELEPAALLDPAAGGALALLPFELATAANDIEVRVRVVEKSRVTVSGYEIRSRP